MFGGLAFMINGKMCITVKNGRIMCRIDPEIHEEVLKRNHCYTVVMGGKEYKGYVYVDADGIKSKKDFFYWINLALEFNKKAKASPKKKKK